MSRVLPLAFLVLAFGAGFAAAAPADDPEVLRLDATLRELEADPARAVLAPAEIARARDALRALAASGRSERAQRAYVAERRIDVAVTTANAIFEEHKLVQLERERDQILLEATRRDADLARREAERLRLQTAAGAEEAARLREAAAAATALSEQTALDAEAARAAAAQARRVAEAQAAEAELAKREAELAMATVDSLRIQMQGLKSRADRRGEVMTLGEAVFAPGQSRLQPDALANLDRVVQFVNADTGKRIRIEGHTDNRGSANLNQVLSQRRAEAVRDALVAAGVDTARITAIGMGEDVPAAPNDTDAGRAKNRRVDVILEAR
jgi:outer membrane protein OmpA-like peptidoglycan-associated protein